jgi:hypothetical protein
MMSIRKLDSKFYFIIFTIFFFNSCVFDSDKKNENYDDYFPLQVGNKWVYTYQGGGEEHETTMKLTSGTSYCYVLDTDHNFYISLFPYGKLLTKNNNGDLMVKVGNMNVVQYAFSDTVVGHNITDIPNYLAILFSTNDSVITPTGTFDFCYNIFLENKNITDSEKSIWFAKDVGPVRIKDFSSGIDMLLKYAVIDGKIINMK